MKRAWASLVGASVLAIGAGGASVGCGPRDKPQPSKDPAALRDAIVTGNGPRSRPRSMRERTRTRRFPRCCRCGA